MRSSKVSLIKHTFFNSSLKKDNDLSFTEESFDLDQLKTEFFSFYQFFLSNKKNGSKRIEIPLYVNYLCDLMICYYQHDYVSSELEQLKKQKKEIEAFIQEHLKEEEKQSIHNFSDFLLNRLKTNLKEYQDTFVSIAKVRNKLATLNTNRSRFGYSRSLATHAIFYLQKSPLSNIIQELNEILGNQYSFIDGLNLLNESRQPLASLGMILFSFRFIVNLILLIKHTIQAAINAELLTKKILRQELEKRGFTMANDLVWSTITLLTTYNNLFHISSLAVSPLILASLIFDTLLLFAQWFFEAKKYNDRLEELMIQKVEATVLEQEIIKRQIDILNDTWETQCNYYVINILGANILAISFAITMICAIPLALAALAIFSMLGNALYNASEEYKKYHQTKVAVKRELSNGMILDDAHHKELINLLNKECSENYIQFWKTLGFNIGGIAFIITAAVACWPVALGLTIAYVGYQLHTSYQKQLNKNTHKEIPPDIYRLLPLDESTLNMSM